MPRAAARICHSALSLPKGAQHAADEAMAARAARVRQVPGIGPTVAAVLQAQMPELGTLTEGQAAARASRAIRERATLPGPVPMLPKGPTMMSRPSFCSAMPFTLLAT